MAISAPVQDFATALATRLQPGLTAGPAWLVERRQQALARFLDLGLPTKRLEAWKYTDLSAIASGSFQVAPPRSETILTAVRDLFKTEAAALRVVLVDGRYAAELSTLPNLPKGVSVESLAGVLEREPDRLQSLLDKAAHDNGRDDALTQLNTAALHDGVLVHLGRNTVLESPLFVEVVTTAGTMAQPRVLIVAEANSQTRIVETHRVLAGAPAFSNVVTEILAGDNAHVEHYLVEPHNDSLFHVGAVYVQQGADSQVTSFNVSLGGPLFRNALHVHLGAKGANIVLNGLYLADGEQHVDNQTVVDHSVPHGTSDELYKGILDDKAVGVFNGRVLVRPHATQTKSAQLNQNLLLSPTAVINTKPQLEIDNDDVACTHGTTIGQIDDNALFYLRSRGIDLDEARSLITVAFASDVVDRIPIETLKQRLNEWLFARLMAGRSQEVST